MNEKNKLFLESIYNNFNYKYTDKNLKIFKLPRLGEVSKINLVIKDIKFIIKKNNWKIIIYVLYNEKGLKKWNELNVGNLGFPYHLSSKVNKGCKKKDLR
jgi:hypothetical protein